ncbi:MAG: hypothetical protein KF726_05270 [Anaerolineae bacterium]|nr:hypothetical protein [Anaerolineae bacterium]
MILDWLSREGGAILIWWLLSTLAGVAVYPLLFRLMGGLPSRGYVLARAAGLMLVAFVYWLLNILGLFRNDANAILLTWLIVLIISVAVYLGWRDRLSIRDWLRQNWRLILVTELLFVGLFFSWCYVRALNPDLRNTEKPMEMAFLNAIRRTDTFPTTRSVDVRLRHQLLSLRLHHGGDAGESQ